jgi:hypothetical protein
MVQWADIHSPHCSQYLSVLSIRSVSSAVGQTLVWDLGATLPGLNASSAEGESGKQKTIRYYRAFTENWSHGQIERISKSEPLYLGDRGELRMEERGDAANAAFLSAALFCSSNKSRI